jgi:hypothetical protein
MKYQVPGTDLNFFLPRLDPDPPTHLNPDPKLCGQVFQCGQCEVSVGSEYLLKVHEKTHVTEATPCNLCGKVVKVRAACFLHISSVFRIRVPGPS